MKVRWDKRGGTAGLMVFGLLGMGLLFVVFCVPVDRMLESVGHRCPMKSLTGYPCASCGSTRALVAAGDLDLGRAFQLNPLATAVFLILCLASPWALLTALFRLPRPHLHEVSTSVRLTAAACVAFSILANWAYVLTRTPPG